MALSYGLGLKAQMDGEGLSENKQIINLIIL